MPISSLKPVFTFGWLLGFGFLNVPTLPEPSTNTRSQMKYKIVLNHAKGNPDEASYQDVIFEDTPDFVTRSLIIQLAVIREEIEYEDVNLIEKVFFNTGVNWIEAPPIPEEKYGVHRTHCCVIHGCKYGDFECPVEKGMIKQDYPCESCSEGDRHNLFGKGDSVEKESQFYD